MREVVPEMWPALEPVYRRVLGGDPVSGVERSVALRPGARSIDWLVSYLPVRRGSEVVEDISERKATERALGARNNLYAMLSRTHSAASRCQSADGIYAEVYRDRRGDRPVPLRVARRPTEIGSPWWPARGPTAAT